MPILHDSECHRVLTAGQSCAIRKMATSTIPSIGDYLRNISSGDLATLPDGEYMIPSIALQNVSNLPSTTEGGIHVKVMSWEGNGYRLYMAITYYLTMYIGQKQPNEQTINWQRI